MDTHISYFSPLRFLLILLGFALPLLPTFRAVGNSEPASGASAERIPAIASRLTTEEKLWIEKHPVIRMGGPQVLAPFFFLDEDGQAQGIAADYTHLIMRSLGIEISVQPDLPWPQVLNRAKNKELDLIPTVVKTREREAYLTFSQAYLSFPLVIIAREESPFIGGLDDLFEKKVACIQKAITCMQLKNDVESFQTVWVENTLKGLEAVAYGEVDVYVGNLASASYQIQTRGLSNLKIAAPTAYSNYKLFFGVRKDWPLLISILNKSLSLITHEQHAAIRNRWLSIRYEHGIRQSDVLRWVIAVAIALLFPTGIVLIWNRRLQQEIEKRKKISLALQKSEKIFTTIFQHSPVSISISSLETGKYLDVNDSVTALAGFSKEDMIGRTEKELNIWVDRELRDQVLATVKKEGTSYNTEFQLRAKNNEIKTGLASGVKIDLGNHPCLMFVTMDITDLKRTEKKLRETQERYSALFERSLHPIVIYDAKGNLIDANPVALDLLKLKKEHVASKNFRDFLTEQQCTEIIEQAKGIMQTGQQEELKEYMITREDRSVVWIETTGSLIYENGVPFAIQGLGRDITARKKTDKEQRNLINQLLEALDNIKSLKGMLPICANCKKIRDDKGYWNQIESYIEKHSDALFSHGICPDCAHELYGKEPWYKKRSSD